MMNGIKASREPAQAIVANDVPDRSASDLLAFLRGLPHPTTVNYKINQLELTVVNVVAWGKQKVWLVLSRYIVATFPGRGVKILTINY